MRPNRIHLMFLHFRLRSETFGIFGPFKFWFSLRYDSELIVPGRHCGRAFSLTSFGT